MRAPVSFLKSSGAPPFDITTLAHSLLFNSENYAIDGAGNGSLAGTASTGGSSAGITLTSVLALRPIVGATQNGFASLDFSGVQRLTSGTAMTSFITTTVFSAWALLNLRSIVTDFHTGGDAYQNQACIADTGGYWGVGFASTGPRVVVSSYPGAGQSTPGDFAISTYKFVWTTQTGGIISVGVNGNAAADTASGAITRAGNLFVGQQSGATMDGLLLCGGVSEPGTAFTPTDYANILSALRTKYALPLA